ncbi:MAG TPA: hypothetical protein VMT17_09935 [Anaeromyxobacteraceae bacterium]|nr:hypothetical protein [Anaeromyxobacteraceae bacterium]
MLLTLKLIVALVAPVAFTTDPGALAAASASWSDAKRHSGGLCAPVGAGVALAAAPFTESA